MARLRPYAQAPARAGAQILADVAVLLWVAGWVLVGRVVHGAVASLGEVGRRVRSGADGIAANLDGAGDGAARVPLVGDTLRTPLRSAGTAAREVAAAGQNLDDRVTWLAVVLAVVVAAPPIVGALVPWLVVRWRFARRAAAAAAVAATPGGERLLALRALAGRPLTRLARIDPDPLDGWLRGDPQIVRRLAALEARAAGLRPPAVTRAATPAAAAAPADDPPAGH